MSPALPNPGSAGKAVAACQSLFENRHGAGSPFGFAFPHTGRGIPGAVEKAPGVKGAPGAWARPLPAVSEQAPAVPLSLTISDPPTQAEVQSILDAYNTLLSALQR